MTLSSVGRIAKERKKRYTDTILGSIIIDFVLFWILLYFASVAIIAFAMLHITLNRKFSELVREREREIEIQII